jgi:PadR family transcriptional regulator, regulatory protein PadR
MLSIIIMELELINWKTQIKKGYLELCILLIIQKREKVYGFELLEVLEKFNLNLKEGTLYPLLNRMTSDGTLGAVWDTENVKGHPRKYYSLTKEGQHMLDEMRSEFERMINIYKEI